MSWTPSPALLTHRTIFCAEVTAAVTICTLASSRIPAIPKGVLIPSWLSTIYS